MSGGLHETHVIARGGTEAECTTCGKSTITEEGYLALHRPCRATGSGDFSIGATLWPGLSKLIEECGEVMQVGGKLIGSEGRTDHWSGDLRKKWIEELGDLRAAITFFIHHNLLDDFPAIEDRTDEKVALFEQWHHETQAKRS